MKKYYLPLTLVTGMLALSTGVSAQESVSGSNAAGINRVYEFCPAPGQFQNTMPEYEEGDTPESMREKAEQVLLEGSIVCLGAFGGYVVMGFDHMVENKPGMYDLQVLGNSYFYSDATQGTVGSSEPAVVFVSYDANGNGLPDDEWYEIAGSEYGKAHTWLDYTVTYYRCEEDHEAVSEPESPISDTQYIRWTDSEGGEGYIEKNIYHQQDYWPLWLKNEATLTFTGTRLKPNGEDVNGDGSMFLQKMYAWGYADNQPNSESASKLDLQWAVDKNGRPANLPGIHFVKVQTSVLQNNGWIGECSTEVSGALDLHLSGGDEASVDASLAILSFEDADYQGDATETSYWSSLVDEPQYRGPLLYGKSGYGVFTEEEAYSWYDKGATELFSMINNAYGSWAYWNGGIAVSDYVAPDLTGLDYNSQLAVYANVSESARVAGGHGASDHFAVVNGVDNTSVGGSDSRAILTFGEGRVGIIDHAYVAPTSYFLSAIINGGYNAAATETTYVDLVAEGYDEAGESTGTVSLRLVDGLHHVDRWTWWDLSSLGKVRSVKLDFQASEDQVGDYGLNTPAYVAIDDIAVREVEEGTSIRVVEGDNPAASSTKMYDLTGRELLKARKGQIVIVNGKKVVY